MSSGNSNAESEKIAIVDWTHLIEDYLDNIGVSFKAFQTEMTGGWLFGYIKSLQIADFRPVFFCFSARPEIWGNYRHLPTDSEICVLPAPRFYRLLREKIVNPYAAEFEQSIIKSSVFPRPLYFLLFSFIEYFSTPIWLLHKEFSSRQITKVISQEYESGRFDQLSVLSKLTGRKLFATFQGGSRTKNKFINFFRNWTVKNCSGLIIGSRVEILRAKKSYKIPCKKTAKIYNPLLIDEHNQIDKKQSRRKFSIDNRAKVAVWHGRIDLHRKGLDLILKCWKLLNERNPELDSKLLFLGDGNDSVEFKKLIESSNLKNVEWFTEFTNNRQKIKEFLSVGDVYIFASRHEGFPVAPLEAMNCGLPLLATNVSGISEILIDGGKSGGIVVNVGDIEGLTENLEKLFLNDDFRLTLGKNAKKRVSEAFSLENVSKQLKEFLNK